MYCAREFFDLIIDSGSQKNIIRRDIVEKLKLAIEAHPNPYTIGWIREVGGIKVIERCKVPFSTDKYYNVIYCDIVDMDAYHILCGRPWQYDIDTKYIGRKNVYQLEKGDVKYTLVPFARKN